MQMSDSMKKIAEGEERIVRGQTMVLNETIECKGRLIFENCVISSGADRAAAGILLGERAELILRNCKVRCERSEEDSYPRHSLVEIPDHCGGTVVCQETEFQDCYRFLETGEEASVLFESCLINNPSGDFCTLGWKNNRLDVQNCTIRLSGSRSTLSSVFSAILTGNTSHVKNCSIESSKAAEYLVLQLRDAEVEGCTFTGITGCIDGAAVIRKCEFRKCQQVIGYLHDSETGAAISDCLFEQCEEVITNLPGQSTIANCRFTDCKDQIISNTDDSLMPGKPSDIRVESCRFSGLTGHEGGFSASLAFRRSVHGRGSVVKDCVFDGARLTEGFLLAGCGEHALRVETCEFLNCTADPHSGGIIQTRYGTDSAGSDDSFGGFIESVVVSNCRGLDSSEAGNGFKESFAMPDCEASCIKIACLREKYGLQNENADETLLTL